MGQKLSTKNTKFQFNNIISSETIPTPAGIPQGSSLSPALSILYKSDRWTYQLKAQEILNSDSSISHMGKKGSVCRRELKSYIAKGIILL
jgi:hypothetical protein